MVGPVFAPAGAQIGWLVLAVVLHVCGQVSRGVAWRGVLAATWPEVTRRRACAWYVCGAGPQRRALPARRRRRPRDAGQARAAATPRGRRSPGRSARRRSFETVSGLTMMLAAVALGVGSLHAPSGRAARGRRGSRRRRWRCLAARSARVRRTVREVGRGAAVLRRPGHCARHVLPFQAGARVLRLGSATCFLLAFGLPVAPAIVVAAVLAQGSGAADAAPRRRPGGHRRRAARRPAVRRRARARPRRPRVAGRRLAGGAHARRRDDLARPARAAVAARARRGRSCAPRARCGRSPRPSSRDIGAGLGRAGRVLAHRRRAAGPGTPRGRTAPWASCSPSAPAPS